MKTKNAVKTGQVWTDKQTGKSVTIGNRASGNRHWLVSKGRKTHHIHEETLIKFYEREQSDE